MVLGLLAVPSNDIRAIILAIVGGIGGKLIALKIFKKIVREADQNTEEWLNADVFSWFEEENENNNEDRQNR